MEEKIFEGLTYLISYPENFRENEKYPLVIYLHGAGTRSKDTERLRNNPSLLNLQKRQNERGYVLIAPLCNGITWDEWMTVLVKWVDTFRSCPYIDSTRIHLTGLSMGGYATWALAILRPEWFASIMPICGGASCGFAKRLVGLPARAFHGLCDRTVDPSESLDVVKAINRAGGDAELILFPKQAHNVWDAVYTNEENYDWFLSFTNEREKTEEKPMTGNYYG